MTNLADASCVACRRDAPRVEGRELDTLMAEVQGWRHESVDGISRLSRDFTFKNFVEAIAFTNAVGEIAEAEGHHPALLTEWGSVRVSWWTHKIKGLHRNDFVMAAKTSALYATF